MSSVTQYTKNEITEQTTKHQFGSYVANFVLPVVLNRKWLFFAIQYYKQHRNNNNNNNNNNNRETCFIIVIAVQVPDGELAGNAGLGKSGSLLLIFFR